jgi:hypothetical protein
MVSDVQKVILPMLLGQQQPSLNNIVYEDNLNFRKQANLPQPEKQAVNPRQNLECLKYRVAAQARGF